MSRRPIVRTGLLAATLGALLGSGGLLGCATTPYTNRTQIMLVSESEEIQLGADAYQEVLRESVIVRDPAAVAIVQRLGERIARVAAKPDYQWEFRVIDDPKMANAFALPGGKVAVYTGIFPVAVDEAGLAAVVAHEVAHVLARHGAERMSQAGLVQLGGAALSIGLGGGDAQTADLIMQAYGLGAQVGVLLPFSRSQESEADHIGLLLMAQAGYDPTAALGLWERMEQTGKNGPPEFLSTHPSYHTRQADIRKWLPAAQRELRQDPTLTIAPLPDPRTLAASRPKSPPSGS